MKLKEVTLRNLHELDAGALEARFKLELQKVMYDLDFRPEVGAARSVSIKVVLKPATEADEGVQVKFEITSKVPTMVSRSYAMKAGKGNTLVFNPGDCEDVDQMTFDGDED